MISFVILLVGTGNCHESYKSLSVKDTIRLGEQSITKDLLYETFAKSQNCLQISKEEDFILCLFLPLTHTHSNTHTLIHTFLAMNT